MEFSKSWLEKLADEQTRLVAQSADPWRLTLENLQGKVDDGDGLERVATQAIFDILQIPQRRRDADAGRRLCKLMTEIGWRPIRLIGLTRGGYREQVRGYCRETRHARPSPSGEPSAK